MTWADVCSKCAEEIRTDRPGKRYPYVWAMGDGSYPFGAMLCARCGISGDGARFQAYWQYVTN